MSVILVQCFIILLGSSSAQTAGSTQQIIDRAYRNISPDIKYLLDSMQSQLKFVTHSLDTVRMKCHSRKSTANGMVAFSARLSRPLASSTASVKVVFDYIVTNIGDAYSRTTGIFTAPSNGVYVFAWTVLTNPKHQFDSEIVVNGRPKLYNAADTGGGSGYESSGCTGVIQLRKGDKVWIRKDGSSGRFLRDKWSSFSGWKLQ